MVPSDFCSRSLKLNRRTWVANASAQVGILALSGQWAQLAWAQQGFAPLNRYPRMLHDWYVAQVRAAELRHVQKIESLKNRDDAEKYVLDVQKKIRDCFGPEPQRTPLNPQVTGVVERDTYRIEKVIFESRPNFQVTANLYIPKVGTGPFPGVVGSCGHSSNGKAAEAYQSFAQGLARLGYVCLIFDPIGQGERLQYLQDDTKSRVGVGVSEHIHAGNQQFLVGESLGAWRAWDGIRALDYLLTRSEVDSKRVGITGNSGGGTMTTWLCGLERRWAMAAPACFVTTFRRNLENELPADTEQCPPHAIALGLDHCDFLAAMAPKPVIILAKEQDFFDVRGAEEAYQRLKKLYRLLGAEKNIALFVGPTDHGYSQENREAMYSWFHHAAQTSLTDANKQDSLNGLLASTDSIQAIREPSLTVETDETLRCSPSGQVASIAGATTVFASTRDKSRRLARERKAVSGTELRTAILDVLKLPLVPLDAPDYRIYRYLGARGYPKKNSICFAVETEPGIEALVTQLTDVARVSRPAPSDRIAVLYLAEYSSDDELRSEPMIKTWAEDRSLDVFACDIRGCGESQPDTCGPNSFRKPYGSEYFYSIHGLMLDRPLLGQKTWDALRVLQWMESLGYKSVQLAGRGRSSLTATFAAVLSPFVKQVTLKSSLESFSALAESEYYDAPLVSILPNVLTRFDLPDCYQELLGKRLQRT